MTQESYDGIPFEIGKTERVLRWPEVKQRTGICRSHAHNLSNLLDKSGNPRFPKPIKLGARASGWLESEIDQWLKERISQSREE